MGLPFFTEHMTYLYPLLLAYPLGSILLWFWARADSGREVAEQELIALNRSLERKGSSPYCRTGSNQGRDYP